MAIDIDEDGETDEFDVVSRSKEPAVKQQPRWIYAAENHFEPFNFFTTLYLSSIVAVTAIVIVVVVGAAAAAVASVNPIQLINILNY